MAPWPSRAERLAILHPRRPRAPCSTVRAANRSVETSARRWTARESRRRPVRRMSKRRPARPVGGSAAGRGVARAVNRAARRWSPRRSAVSQETSATCDPVRYSPPAEAHFDDIHPPVVTFIGGPAEGAVVASERGAVRLVGQRARGATLRARVRLDGGPTDCAGLTGLSEVRIPSRSPRRTRRGCRPMRRGTGPLTPWLRRWCSPSRQAECPPGSRRTLCHRRRSGRCRPCRLRGSRGAGRA